MKTTTLAIAAAFAAGGAAHAQEAVQWRVEDGGNGHWYQLLPTMLTWSAAHATAELMGGYLATCTSSDEQQFVQAYLAIHPDGGGNFSCWLGGLQAPDAPSANDGWSWVTGEPWTHPGWASGEPNDCCGPTGSEDRLEMYFDNSGWNDIPGTAHRRSLLEWSADCNGDGIVDYGQILDGTLVDCDGNTIPDSCDTSFADCNANGVPDPCDIADGRLADCNGNLIADECEATIRPDLDCDGDGQLDECQIADDPALDVSGDGILDACTIAIGDFTLDGIVNGGDLAVLLSVWGSDDADIGDLTGDGLIDGEDLTHLLGNWGAYQGGWYTILELLPPPEVIVDVEVRSRIAATGLPWRIRDIGSGIEMLLVPPGTFVMGCSASYQFGCLGHEHPRHEVTLTQPFYLGRYEVTQAQWTAVMNGNPSWFDGDADSPMRPVENVSWTMIQEFEAATGLRLPSEAEWEYACRAGTHTAFHDDGDTESTLDAIAWYSPNSQYQTHPVGMKLPNRLGLHDMHGNVWEWVEDWYAHDYYADSPRLDPTGPGDGTYRVNRGGSWANSSAHCRSSVRNAFNPGGATYAYGFRAARSP